MRYQLVETKEEGCNSTVVLARDVIKNIRVAIKMIESREMACGEIEAMSMMDHPNIMHLIDCYEMADNEAYAVVMPVVDMNLSEFMGLRHGKGKAVFPSRRTKGGDDVGYDGDWLDDKADG